MTVLVAIDFGTARTKLAYIPAPGRAPELLRFFDNGAEWSFVPSLFYIPREGDVLVGFDAEAMLQEDPAGVIDDLKRRLREPRRRANGRDIGPEALLTQLLAFVRAQAQANAPALAGEDLEALVTVPATFGPTQRDVITRAVLGAGFARVAGLIDEPIAAARGWLADRGETVSDLVVVDCGGGTVDWAWLARDPAGRFRIAPERPPSGLERLGGHDVDEGLVQLVEQKLADAGIDSVEFSIQRRVRLRERLRRIKENVLRTRGPSASLRVGGDMVTLAAEEIEEIIQTRFVAQTLDALSTYLRQVNLARGDAPPPPVLLVGGSSRLPGLRAAVESLGCTVVPWDRADFAAAIGALAEDRPALVSNAPEAPLPTRPGRRAPQVTPAPEPRPEVPADDSPDIAAREANVALEKRKPDRALLLALAGWTRSYDLGATPSEALYDVIERAAAADSRLKRTDHYHSTMHAMMETTAGAIILAGDYMEILNSKTLEEKGKIFDHQLKAGAKQSRDKKYLLQWGGRIRITDLARLTNAVEIARSARGLDISPDGRRLLIHELTGVKQIDIQSKKTVARDITLELYDYLKTVEYCPRGRFILTASGQGAIEWDAADGARSGRAWASETPLDAALYRAGGAQIMTVSVAGDVQIWDRQTGAPIGAAFKHEEKLRQFMASEDEAVLATVGADGLGRVWKLSSTEAEGVILQGGKDLLSAIPSPQGLLVAGFSQHAMMFWSACTGERVGDVIPLEEPSCAVFSPDGKRLLVKAQHELSQWDMSGMLLSGDELVFHVCHDRANPCRPLIEAEIHASLFQDLPADPAQACRDLFTRAFGQEMVPAGQTTS